MLVGVSISRMQADERTVTVSTADKHESASGEVTESAQAEGAHREGAQATGVDEQV